jgi:hypothetical protein
MKRRQIRFETEQEILQAIDAAKIKAADCLTRAIDRDKVADISREMISKEWSKTKPNMLEVGRLEVVIRNNRDEARKLSRQRNTIENVKLPKLKNALSAFRTGLLSITQDPGVVLQ